MAKKFYILIFILSLMTYLCYGQVGKNQNESVSSSSIKFIDTLHTIESGAFVYDLGNVPRKDTLMVKYFKYVGLDKKPALITGTWTGDPYWIKSYPQGVLKKDATYNITISFPFNGTNGKFEKHMGFYLSTGEVIKLVFKGNVIKPNISFAKADTAAYTLSSKAQQIPDLVKDLKFLFARADTLNPFKDNTSSETIDSLNQAIYNKLSEILLHPAIKNFKIDSLLKINSLGFVYSPDKRLWIFNWYENTGGSFKSNISLLHYVTKNGKGKVGSGLLQNSNNVGQNVFESNGSWFNQVYKLNSKTKNLYLCMNSIIGCNTCCAEVATVIELTADSIDFTYPAFSAKKSAEYYSRFSIDSRCGDIKEFLFNSKTQTLSYSYKTDDNTPVKTNYPEKSKNISGRFTFNGKQFVLFSK